MSIRSALILVMAVLLTAATTILGVVGAISINQSIFREAQSRVDHDLDVVSTNYRQQIQLLSDRLGYRATGIRTGESDTAARMQEMKRALHLGVLNLCDATGGPLIGSFRDGATKVPINEDPVLRQALAGKVASGTVALDAERLEIEGGPALRNAMLVGAAGGSSESDTTKALFWWFATPIRDSSDRVVALLYGGRALNFNHELVDEMRELVFGAGLYNQKPLGTVTIFLGSLRVATNVRGPDRTRAIGTRVSSEVQRKVLVDGQRWSARAWVVDAWYFSGYEPIADPDGKIIGMLYVGLLEAPYAQLRRTLMLRFLAPVVVIGVLAVLAALVLVRRITRPLWVLGRAAERLTRGDQQMELNVKATYTEIKQLAKTFTEMERAIADRDRQVWQQNETLAETNEKLQRANSNYMKMLGFITHEMKNPLAVIQTIIDVIVENFLGEVPDKVKQSLIRIKRNCEEMTDMVKNYLDLSRAERGELVPTKTRIAFRQEVVDPCVMHVGPLFESRGMKLEVSSPDDLEIEGDGELLRIALSNYLTNAAKYGREGGLARLQVTVEGDEVTVCVWNEGIGFSEAEGEVLFNKFSRIRNENTRNKRGSGMGLFLSREMVGLHGGRTWGESEQGKWARFCFTIPRSAG